MGHCGSLSTVAKAVRSDRVMVRAMLPTRLQKDVTDLAWTHELVAPAELAI